MRSALTVVAALAALGVAALMALPAGARLPDVDASPGASAGVDRLDFGDAPDDRATGYGPKGRFPSLLRSNGSRAVVTDFAFLGKAVTRERDSRQVNNDARDDGVLLTRLARCRRGDSRVLVSLPSAGLPDRGTAYLNLWFDWNRDGDWRDVDRRCGKRRLAPEWAVRNRPVDLSAQQGIEEIYRFRFRAGAFAGPMWFRAVLSVDQRLRAPKGVVERGEVEDYLLAREPALQPYVCFDTDIEHGKTGTLTIAPNGVGPAPRILSARLLLTKANTAERRISPNPGRIAAGGRRATFGYRSKRVDTRLKPVVIETVRIALRMRKSGKIVMRVVRCKVSVTHDAAPASSPGSEPGGGEGGTGAAPAPPASPPAPTSKRIPNVNLGCVVGVQSTITFRGDVFVPANATNIRHQLVVPGTDQPLPRPICPGTTETPDTLTSFAPGVTAPDGQPPPPGKKTVRVEVAAQGEPVAAAQSFDVKVSWDNP